MEIILLSQQFSRVKPVVVTPTQAALAVAGLLFLVASLVAAAALFASREAVDIGPVTLQQWLMSVTSMDTPDFNERENSKLDRAAARIGQIQARIERLFAQGEVLAGADGPQRGGLLVKGAQVRGPGGHDEPDPQMVGRGLRPAKTLQEIVSSINRVTRQVDARSDLIDFLDTLIFEREVRLKSVPTTLPVKDAMIGSEFGFRIDPFSGYQAMHEGLDFVAETGTPVYAAAGGVVTFAAFHPEYGRMLEIDHGNGLATRYAHCSQLLVREGDVVLPGARIASVGGTGRATGPHLHFEVRLHGIAQNPRKFLQAGALGLPGASLTRNRAPG